MKNVLMGTVEHTTSCTRVGVKGWACRVYANGKLQQEKLAATRQEIGPAFHEMLRRECKCGNYSKMADRSRFRYWEKLDKLNAERKANILTPTTTNK
jgi:hypothetical protein